MHDPRFAGRDDHSTSVGAGRGWCPAGDPPLIGGFRGPRTTSTAGATPAGSHPAAADSDDWPPLGIRCFGGLEIVVDDVAIDLNAIRPRARSLLRMLCLHAGRPVSEGRFLHAFWPDQVRTKRHNLHVAVSAARSLLQQGRGRTRRPLLEHRAGAYLLRLPPGSALDVATVEAAARELTYSAQPDLALFRAAVEAYRGHLFPEEGEAEWIVHERDRLRYLAARVAAAVARHAIAADDSGTALMYADRAVSIDRMNDDAWHMLVHAHRSLGNHAAAQRVGRRYHELLKQLDVDEPDIGSRPSPADPSAVRHPPPPSPVPPAARGLLARPRQPMRRSDDRWRPVQRPNHR